MFRNLFEPFIIEIELDLDFIELYLLEELPISQVKSFY